MNTNIQQQKPSTSNKTPPTNVKHSLLEMTQPYCYYSALFKSIFSGLYGFFFIYSIYFALVYPIIKLMKDGSFMQLAVVKVTETNILWDLASFIFFVLIAILLMTVGNPEKRSHKLMIAIYVLCFTDAGYYVVDNMDMYFTDRIFIVVLSWLFLLKMSSYELDCKCDLAIRSIPFKLRFLISPIIVYAQFAQEHDPTLPIHKLYLAKKVVTSLMIVFVTNILLVEFIDPIYANAGQMSFIAVFFKMIPYTLYMNIILYYLVMENVLSALSEVTQIRNRVAYQDWWNAETIEEYLLRWTVLMNNFTLKYFPTISRRVMVTAHVSLLLLMLLSIFGRGVNLESVLLFGFLTIGIYFLGGVRFIQNNYIVHLLSISFTPLLITVQAKYTLFAATSFWASM